MRAAGVMCCALAAAGSGRAQAPVAGPGRPLAERQPLVVGGSTDSYPYSFVDESGQVRGFCVELSDAVARTMNLRIRRITLPGKVLNERFRAGDFDLLQNYSQSPEREAYVDFSVPYLTLQSCLYVAKTGSPIHTLADLNDHELTIVSSGSVAEAYVRAQGLRPRIRLVGSAEEAVMRVERGQSPAVLVSRLTAVTMIERLGLKNVQAFGEPLPADYDFRHSFALHKGDAPLLAQLNEGLAILHRTGEFDRIYRKWFGKIDAPGVTREELANYVAGALAIALLAAVWGWVRQRSLSKRIAGQAAQLAEKEALLQALYDNIPMAMCVLENEPGGERVLAINRQAEEHFGVPVRQAAGRPLAEFNLEREWAGELRELLRRELAAGEFVREERRLAVARKNFVFTLVPLAPGSAGHARVCVLAEDVTERRSLDEELAQTRKLRAVGELVGGIAHEFNNLLTPVMLKAGEIQLDWAQDSKLQQQVTVIIQAAQRAAELTRRLLTFGRKGDSRAESVRLSAVTAGCFELMRSTVDRRIIFESAVPEDLPPLWLNATDLNQILLNLLLNSRDTLLEKLSRQSGGWTPCIRVEAKALSSDSASPMTVPLRRPPLGWQQLTVSDNGLGMTPAVRERIFEPFYTTKEVGKGTGLGLATVWHLVSELGGRIELETIPGEGSTFRLLLPVWPAPEVVETPVPVAAPLSTGRARVFLAEDEPLVAEAIAEALRRAGHEVMTMGDGNLAWDHLKTRLKEYDLLVFDVNMPGLDGIELSHRSRASHYVGRLMIVSGRLTLPQLQAINRARVDRVLAKPFSMTEFSNAVRECLRRTT